MNQAINDVILGLSAGFVVYLPGLVLSFVFFRRGAIDIIERTALSFALSIAVVPLVGFYLNLVGVKISRINVILEVAAIIAVALIVAWRRGSFKAGEKALKEPPAEPPTTPTAPEATRPPHPPRKRPIARL